MKVLTLTSARADLLARPLRQPGFIVDETHTADAALGMLHAFTHDALLAIVTNDRVAEAALEVLQSRRRASRSLTAVTLLAPDMQHWTERFRLEDAWILPVSAPQAQIAEVLRASRVASRRQAGPRADPDELIIDHDRRRALRGEREIMLTAQEYLLLELLSRNRGRLFRRDEILRRAWPSDYVGEDRVVDTYVKRLRQKLGDGVIETVRRFGYRFPEQEVGGGPKLPPASLDAPEAVLARLARALLPADSTSGALDSFLAAVQESCGVNAVGFLPRRTPRPPYVWSGSPHPSCCGASRSGEFPGGPTSPRPCLTLGLLNPTGNEWARLKLCLSGPLSAAGELHLRGLSDVLNVALLAQEERAQRQAAQAELRDLTRDLETRVTERTYQLATEMHKARRAQRALQGLHRLGLLLERTRGVHDLAARALPALCAELALDAAALLRAGSGGTHVLGSHGLTPGEVEAVQTSILPAGRARERWYDLLHVPAGFTHGRGRTLLQTPTESFVLALLTRAPSWGAGARLLALAAGSLSFTLERNLSFEYLQRAALTDQQTGVPNLQAFLADVHAELAFMARQGGGFTLALVEFTNLKDINDREGYAAGSDILHDLVRVARSTLRAEDRLYRLTGNTLAALLRCAAPRAARGPLGRLERYAWQTYGERVRLRTSIRRCPADARDLSGLLRSSLEHLTPLQGAPT